MTILEINELVSICKSLIVSRSKKVDACKSKASQVGKRAYVVGISEKVGVRKMVH